MSDSSPVNPLLEKLASLRVELIDLAFVMDRRGRPEAADVAMTISARLGELSDEFNDANVMRSAEAIGSRS